MKTSALLVAVAVFASGAAFNADQGALLSATEQAAIVDFAQTAVARALNNTQGDRESLMDAQNDFTPDAWREFMKRMDGFLDAKGAPTFSAEFVASGKPVAVRQENGMLFLSIPGQVKQQARNAFGGVSTTTYLLTVDVQVGGRPIRIAHMEQTTCGAKPCEPRMK